MSRNDIERVRAFNRTVTAALGVLEDRFLGRDRPLGEARLLWEVGDGETVRGLRRRLGLDSGYCSRLLRALEEAGLVVLTPDVTDARIRWVHLTDAGREEVNELDRRSDSVAWSLLEPLSAADRNRLVSAMGEVQRLVVQARTVISEERPTSADVLWCFARYADELDRRFEDGFDVARSNRADAAYLSPPAGFVLLARIGDDPIACGAAHLHPDGIAELKRMWVSPRVRGCGVGRRMLVALERQATERGARVARLETNRHLGEAVTLYRSAGYQEVAAFNDEPYADHWFEKPLTPPGRQDGTHGRRRAARIDDRGAVDPAE